jgi:hypothetical protein
MEIRSDARLLEDVALVEGAATDPLPSAIACWASPSTAERAESVCALRALSAIARSSAPVLPVGGLSATVVSSRATRTASTLSAVAWAAKRRDPVAAIASRRIEQDFERKDGDRTVISVTSRSPTIPRGEWPRRLHVCLVRRGHRRGDNPIVRLPHSDVKWHVPTQPADGANKGRPVCGY